MADMKLRAQRPRLLRAVERQARGGRSAMPSWQDALRRFAAECKRSQR